MRESALWQGATFIEKSNTVYLSEISRYNFTISFIRVELLAKTKIISNKWIEAPTARFNFWYFYFFTYIDFKLEYLF